MRSVRTSTDISQIAEQMLTGIVTLRREEALLNTPRAVVYERDPHTVEEQAIAAGVAALRAHMLDLTGDHLGYRETRALFLVALDAYSRAHAQIGRSL